MAKFQVGQQIVTNDQRVATIRDVKDDDAGPEPRYRVHYETGGFDWWPESMVTEKADAESKNEGE